MACCLVFGSARGAEADWQEQTLEIVIDDVSYGASWVCLPARDLKAPRYFLGRDFFQRVSLPPLETVLPAGVTQGCRSQDYAEAQGASFTYEALNARLVGRLEQGVALGLTRVEPDALAAPPAFEPTTHAALFNYSAYSARSAASPISVFDLGTQIFTDWGQVALGRQYTRQGGKTTAQWTNLLLRRDFFEQRLSLVVGRQSGYGYGYGAAYGLDLGATEFDGVTLTRRDTDDYDQRPGVLPSIRGFMPQPGTVAVRQSNRVVRVLNLPAGAFEFADPALSTSVPADLELRGEGGELLERVQVLVRGGLNLLQPGRTEWSVGMGRERTLVGTGDSDPASGLGLNASVRHGVSASWMVEAAMRLSRQQGNGAGISVVRDLTGWGSVSLGVTMQREVAQGLAGWRPTLVAGYRIDRQGYSLDYRARYDGSRANEGARSSRWEHAGSAGASFSLGPGEFRGSLNLQHVPYTSPNSGTAGSAWSGSLAGSYNWRLFNRVPIQVYITRTWSGLGATPLTQVGATITLSTRIGPGHLMSQARLEPSRSTLRETYTVPLDEGISASLSTSLPNASDANATVTWDHPSTQGWASVNHGRDSWSGSVAARGAVAYFDGQFLPARHAGLDSSLAIVKLSELPGVAVVPVGSNRVLARANGEGYVALTDIEPRTALNYAVHGEEVPEGMKLPRSLISGALRRWSASVVEPRVRHVMPGSLRLVDERGIPLKSGSLIASDLSEETNVLTVVDDEGGVFIDDVEGFPQRFYAFLAPDYGRVCQLGLPEDRTLLSAASDSPLTLTCQAR